MQAVEGVFPFRLEPLEKIVVLARSFAAAPPPALTRFLQAEPCVLFLTLDREELVWLVGHSAVKLTP
jgi:hypothetical protein